MIVNATWITLAVVVISGAVKFFSYLYGPGRRLRLLRAELMEKCKQYEQALAKNNTILISQLDLDMRRLRKEINSLSR